MCQCKILGYERMRCSWVEKNRSWDGVDRQGTEYNVGCLMGFLHKYMVQPSMFLNRSVNFGSFGLWLTTKKGLLWIRSGGYMILGTLSKIMARLSTLETNTT